MRRSIGCLVIAVALTLTSCASIVSKSEWPVTITSREPVTFSVTDENGVKRAAGTTPATLLLPASDGYFDRQTYRVETASGTREVSPDLNLWYCGNVILGGAVGLLIVDPLTGAMWRLPEVVDLDQIPAGPAK